MKTIFKKDFKNINHDSRTEDSKDLFKLLAFFGFTLLLGP